MGLDVRQYYQGRGRGANRHLSLDKDLDVWQCRSMTTATHAKPKSMAPDPETLVPTNIRIPEPEHHAASLLARRRRCDLGTIVTEGLRMVFRQVEVDGREYDAKDGAA